MTNEEILNSRWKSVDKYLKNYLKHYKEINFKTRDNLQTIFDSIDVPYNDLNKIIPSHIKNRLNRYIDELKENNLLQGYFGYTAKLIRNRKNINYREYLEFMILSVYIKEYYEIKDYNTDSFYRICENAYNQGIKDIRSIKTVKSETFNMSIFYTLMNLPLLETTAENYLYSISLTNANDMYKQTLINLQLGKDLNIDNRFFKDVLQKQMNRYINFNGDKLSGAIVNISENLVNKSYLQAGVDNDVDQCRFIAELDKRTTKMCESLDNQLFYLNKMNIYQRYSEADKKYVTYHTNGLALGENLPPINNHFHWCRSTITYLINTITKKYKDITRDWLMQKKIDEHFDVKMLDKEFCYKGIKYEIDGHFVKYEFCKGEKTFAEWLSKNSNKKITLLPKINKPEKIQTPDYIIDNEYFDYKNTTGSSDQLIYHNIYTQKEQSKNFIININSEKLTLNDIYSQIDIVYKRIDWVEKIAIKKDDIFIIFERK